MQFEYKIRIFKVLDEVRAQLGLDSYRVFWTDQMGYSHSYYFDTYTDALAFKYDLMLGKVAA